MRIARMRKEPASITIQTISRLTKGLGLPPFYLLTFPADDERDQVVDLSAAAPQSFVEEYTFAVSGHLVDAQHSAATQSGARAREP